MKKEYSFLSLIVIMLYLLYLIISHNYKDYNINKEIDFTLNEKKEESNDIEQYKKYIAYLFTNANKDKRLKESQGYNNPGEKVFHITVGKRYDGYLKAEKSSASNYSQEVYESMNNYEKWNYFLFKKDIR